MDANSRYDVKLDLTVTDVTPGKDARVEFEGSHIWRGLNYGGVVGLEELLNSTTTETVEWGRAMAEMLGQPVPSDLVKKKTPSKK